MNNTISQNVELNKTKQNENTETSENNTRLKNEDFQNLAEDFEKKISMEINLNEQNKNEFSLDSINDYSEDDIKVLPTEEENNNSNQKTFFREITQSPEEGIFISLN